MGKSAEFTSTTWWAIAYPEHYPDGITSQDIASKLGSNLLQGFVSPLHASDSHDEPDGIRKPHFHVMVKFSSKKSWKQFEEALYSADFVENFFHIDHTDSIKNRSRIHNWQSCSRYLIHLDNPEKQQFPDGTSLVCSFGGLDYCDTALNSIDISTYTMEMVQYITENNIADYAVFMAYCIKERPEWFRVCEKNHSSQTMVWRVISSINSRIRQLYKNERPE